MIHDLHGIEPMPTAPAHPRILIDDVKPQDILTHSGRRWRVIFIGRYGRHAEVLHVEAMTPAPHVFCEELVVGQSWLDGATR